MNDYCALHGQFYSEFCKYCGPPDVIYTGAANTADVCPACFRSRHEPASTGCLIGYHYGTSSIEGEGTIGERVGLNSYAF